ncbi:MAG: zinc ABC transporter substrate-binding protein, partial [Verrucomicrobiae bacterium]|nr:zinc ABC transporter substrate-binding protein [Verrucomicrobiae bacterium]
NETAEHRSGVMRFLLLLCFLIAPLHAAKWKVAVLHPLLGDLASKVGGDRVEVIDLIGPNGDPHHFEPQPADLQRAGGAKLWLVAGMGLESYLPALRSVVGNGKLCEVGETLPALEGECDHEGHDHGSHEHGKDPHWWHSIDLFRRAVSVVEAEFAAVDSEHAADYRHNAENFRKALDDLERWAKRELLRIPKNRRQLATAHAAFNYFCKDFGFTAVPIQGINREQTPTAKELAVLIEKLRDQHVTTVFPERESNPKILRSLARDTGIRIGGPLIADGTGAESYEAMVRHNVNAIVKELAPAKAPE